MHDYQNFSSMQPEIERHFVPFERRTVEDSKKAWVAGLATAGGMVVIALILLLGFDKAEPIHEDAFESDIPAESRAPRPVTAPAPTPEPAAAEPEATETETEGEGEGEGAGAEDGEAAEGGEDADE